MIVFSARGRGGVHQLQFLPDGELVARTGTGLCVWNLDSRELRIDNTESVRCHFVVTSDGRSLVGDNGHRGLRVYSLADSCWVGKPLQRRMYYPSFMLWSPDGQSLMVGGQSARRPSDHFYRVSDWTPTASFFTRLPGESVAGRFAYRRHATVSPDGRRAVSYAGGSLDLYDLTADKFVKTIALPIEHPKPGLFTLDGSRFLVWSLFKIHAIDLDSGKVAVSYPACPRMVAGATLTPDGRHLLQVSADRTVRVLDVATGQLVKDYAWNAGCLNAVAVSPDGLLAACGGTGGKVVVWDLDL